MDVDPAGDINMKIFAMPNLEVRRQWLARQWLGEGRRHEAHRVRIVFALGGMGSQVGIQPYQAKGPRSCQLPAGIRSGGLGCAAAISLAISVSSRSSSRSSTTVTGKLMVDSVDDARLRAFSQRLTHGRA